MARNTPAHSITSLARVAWACLAIKLRVKQHVFEECAELPLRIAKMNLENPAYCRRRRLEIGKRPRVDRSVREVRHAMPRQIEVQFPAHLARHFIGTCIERLPCQLIPFPNRADLMKQTLRIARAAFVSGVMPNDER